jgi:hypothetical protein
MKKPLRSQFGYSKKTGWQDERDRDLYDAALLQWYNQPKQTNQPGRRRDKPMHPSWVDYVAHFDLTDSTRSQGAFCRWAGIRSSSLSAAKNKPITDKMEVKLSEWIEELEKDRTMSKPNNNTPPPWSEAPDWAMWRAQDYVGEWWWYEEEPKPHNRGIFASGGEFAFGSERKKAHTSDANPNWKSTLEKRPSDE